MGVHQAINRQEKTEISYLKKKMTPPNIIHISARYMDTAQTSVITKFWLFIASIINHSRQSNRP
eukprot:13605699-Ditylum_brightwellii.AAC.1